MYRVYKSYDCSAACTDEFTVLMYRTVVSLTFLLFDAQGDLISAARAYDDGRKGEYSFSAQDGSGKVIESKRGGVLASHNRNVRLIENGKTASFRTYSGIFNLDLHESGEEPEVCSLKSDKYSVRAEFVSLDFNVAYEFAGSLIKAANAFECRFETPGGEGLYMNNSGLYCGLSSL